MVFDLLWLNGKDLRDLPLLERKKILRSIIPQKSTWVGYVSYVDQHAAKLFDLVMARDLEGVVVKRKDGKYRLETRWYKVLPTRRKPAARIFSRPGKGARHEFILIVGSSPGQALPSSSRRDRGKPQNEL